MKYLQLVACLSLCTLHPCQAMEIVKKKKKREIIKTIKCNISVYTGQRDFEKNNSTHPYAQDIQTHFILKGIDWNEVQLIQKGINNGGNINYANSENNNLRPIQIACKEASYDVVKELLKSPGIRLRTYDTNTEPAFHLAVKRGNKNIIDLLIKHDPKIINIIDKNIFLAFLSIKYASLAFLLEQTDRDNNPLLKEIWLLIAKLFYKVHVI